MKFNILGMAIYDIILGMPWLRKNNPIIDWRTKQLKFEKGLIIKAWEPGKLLDIITDKKTKTKY